MFPKDLRPETKSEAEERLHEAFTCGLSDRSLPDAIKATLQV